MVKIRLRRTGKKNQPSYRIVVADARSPRDGRFIDNIGYYNPLTDPETVVFDKARALYWVANGAQPTEAVERMLRKAGIFEALPRYHAGEDPEAIFAEAEAEPAAAQS
jgi:small subunit ribosomal protein S16